MSDLLWAFAGIGAAALALLIYLMVPPLPRRPRRPSIEQMADPDDNYDGRATRLDDWRRP